MNDTTENPTEQSAEEDKLPTPDDFDMSHPSNINPDVLQNISVNLSIEVGRTQIRIKDLMRLTQGSVVELAQGEVVLVNDRYGIRLTRVVPSTERLKSI